MTTTQNGKWLPVNGPDGVSFFIPLHEIEADAYPDMSVSPSVLVVGERDIAYDQSQKPGGPGPLLPAKWATATCDGVTYAFPLYK